MHTHRSGVHSILSVFIFHCGLGQVLLLAGCLISLALLPAMACAQTNFGSVDVGNNAWETVTLTISASATVETIAVLTRGAPNLDFIDGGGGTCAVGKAYTKGATCTVTVSFAPTYSGVRYGGVVLEDGAGNTIANLYLKGTGLGPLATLLPVPVSTLISDPPVSFAQVLAVDGSGNIFVTGVSPSTEIGEILAAGGYTTIKTTTQLAATDAAVDGSGNLFVADGKTVNEILAAGGYTTVKPLGTGSFINPTGVAVDGAGNVFVADQQGGKVKEILAAGGYTKVREVGSGFVLPLKVRVDASGNVFVGDQNSTIPNGTLSEVLAEGGYVTVKPLSETVPPWFWGIDGNGNVVFYQQMGNTVYELLAAGGYNTLVTVATDYDYELTAAIDDGGNIIAGTYGSAGIVKMNFGASPSLTFSGLPSAGSMDLDDGPLTVNVLNNGNETLTFTTPATGRNPGYPANFPENRNDKNLCDAGTPLDASAVCDVSMNFVPTSAGANTGSVVLADDALYQYSSTQSIPLKGTGATSQIIWWPPDAITYGTPLSGAQLYAVNIVAGTFTYNPPPGTVLTAGTHTLSVTFTPTYTAYYAVQTATVQLTVHQAKPTIRWAPAPLTYGAPLSSAQLDATAPAAGTFVYSPAAGTVFTPGKQTLSVTFTPTDTTDYTSATADVSLMVGPAVLTVTANNVSSPYGAALPTLTYAVNGLVNGDKESVVSGTPALTTTATISSPLGDYPIVAAQGTLSAANYTFRFVNGTLTITQASQTIAFPSLGAQTAGTDLDLAAHASSSSGLMLGFASLTSSVCKVSGPLASLLAAGSCTIQATQAGNDDYLAAAAVTQTFTVGPATETGHQTVTFPPIGTQIAATTVNLKATASSGLPVAFVSLTPSVCTVSGATATLIAYGFCYVQAWQGGNSQYYPAPAASQGFGVAHAHQTVDFPAIPTQVAGTTVNLVATASSGLPVTFSTTTPAVCTVSGSTATLIEYGFCRVVATQAGNGEYLEAVASQEFGVGHAH
jgi:hypothetical protein